MKKKTMIHHQTSWPFYVIFISFNIANDFQKKKSRLKKKKELAHAKKKILTFVSFLCYRLAVTTSISISLDSFIVFRLAFHSFFFKSFFCRNFQLLRRTKHTWLYTHKIPLRYLLLTVMGRSLNWSLRSFCLLIYFFSFIIAACCIMGCFQRNHRLHSDFFIF